ncbi:putative NBD/HSP70 family sugar kinase [Kribbella voronezhensis]|uniref:Putative NBD/HSP70 family sugar kinase n=1 Tax=Kribbella voronezhensis TaxID=2512212 RepID=A0A4R7TA07_9ACTN|nr:ROK family protein [Kribbella voronezhensis]TDU88078.1 putative NBD/HSP70 family sugar kinase [Kribbella voronezhensis]
MTEEPSGGDLSRLRQLNAQAVLRALRDDKPLTLTELAKRTGLSRASTEDVARELIERGWVAEAEPTAGTVGRPARRYRFRADAGRVLGVDIGGHSIRALVTDLDGEVQHSTSVAVTPQLGRKERLAALDTCVAAALTGADVTAGQIWSTGVATTGLVDGTGKVMLSDSLAEWTGVDLAAHLRKLVGAPARVENDSKVAALAESWRGVARHAKDVVFLLAGVRTGTGLIIDGKLHRGFGNAAGEIGALPAIGWLKAPDQLRAWAGGKDEFEDVFLAARNGDRAAVRAVRRYTRDIAIGVSALILTLDPELLVIGGGFSRSADLVLQPLRAELDRWCLRTPEIRVSTFGDEGVALGAVRLALEQVESRLYDGTELSPAGIAGASGRRASGSAGER